MKEVVRQSQLERRTNLRYRVCKSGLIACKFSGQDYACTVLNMSATGATISTLAYAALSKAVALLIIGEKLVYPAEVVWKGENRVGLKFTGVPTRL